MYFVDNHRWTSRPGVLAAALISSTLTLQIGSASAQGGTGMSDMKKMAPMSDAKAAKSATATGTVTVEESLSGFAADAAV